MDYNNELASYYSAIQAQSNQNNAWSAEQAQKQMDFQERMSNTAHQREVADLRAAGLNPVLSAGGQGATTGSGAMASRSDANIEALYGLASKAFEAQIKQAEADKVSAKAISGSAGAAGAASSDYFTLPENEILESGAVDVLKRVGMSTTTAKKVVKGTKELVEDIMRTVADKAAGAYGISDPVEAYKAAAADAQAKLSGTYARDHDNTPHKVTLKGLGEAVKEVVGAYKDFFGSLSARRAQRRAS